MHYLNLLNTKEEVMAFITVLMYLFNMDTLNDFEKLNQLTYRQLEVWVAAIEKYRQYE